MEVMINYWAVFGAVVVSVILGVLWYGPFFGKQWMRTVGISHEQMEEAKRKGMPGMWRTYAMMAVGTLLMAYVLAHVIAAFGESFDQSIGGIGVNAGLWMWIGFVAPVTLGNVLWEGRPWKYWFIVSGYYLVSLILMGIIITSDSF
ncbi:MAG TPA: DUF1761 domain-containing protein [Candidatus Paceibacterota bacterium]|jgi:hypothetical protein